MSDATCPACRGNVDDRAGAAAEETPRCHGSTTGPPTSSTTTDLSLVTIETFEFLPRAEGARGFLEEQGIPAFLMDAEIVAMNWTLGNAVGFIKLQVPSDRAALALSLLREQREAEPDLEDAPEPEAPAEDEEESADTTSMLDTLRSLKRPLIWVFLAPMILGLGFGLLATLSRLVQSVIGR